MYDQYGSSRNTTKTAGPKGFTKKNTSKPSKSVSLGGFEPDPAQRSSRGLGSKPTFNFGTDDSGADNNPNRDAMETRSTVDKLYDKAVTLLRNFGANEPEDVIVDGKAVYKGPAFRGYDPTTRIGDFGGEYGKKQYLFGMPSLGEVTPRSPTPPTLPPAVDNPSLNMFGVTRGAFRTPDPMTLPDTMDQDIPETSAALAGIPRALAKAATVPTPPTTEEDYIIQVGDTLSEIAQDRGTTVEVLQEMNNIPDSKKNDIFAGDKLKVPPKLTDTQAALRRGFDRDKDTQGVETASIGDFFKSLVGMQPSPKVGLMSKPNNVDPTGLEGPEQLQDFTDVKNAQIKLAELGYNIGRGGTSNLKNLKIINNAQTKPSEIRGVDGIKGKNTTAAIKEFQKDNNLLVTGNLDASTVAALSNPKKPTLKMDDKKYSTTEQNDNMRRVRNEAIKQGITGLELVSLMSQVAHESADFKRTEEYASGSAYEGRKDLGNTQKGDGVKYKGRSFIQITGKSNYKKIGDKLGLDLINNPTLLEDPDTAARATVEWWKDNVQPLVGDFSDVERVTKIINGGFNGLKDRKNNYNEFLTRE